MATRAGHPADIIDVVYYARCAFDSTRTPSNGKTEMNGNTALTPAVRILLLVAAAVVTLSGDGHLRGQIHQLCHAGAAHRAGVWPGILNFIPFIGFWLGLISLEFSDAAQIWPRVGCWSWWPDTSSSTRNGAEHDPAVAGCGAAQPDALHKPVPRHLLAAGAGACRGDHRRAADHAVHSLLLDADPTTRWLADLMGTKIPKKPSESAEA